MIIRRNQHVADSETHIVDCGFCFDRYDRYGVQKYIDDAGNAIRVNREGIVVTIYSHEAGADVNELAVKNLPCRRWPAFDHDDYNSELASQQEILAAAWDMLLASLPQPKEVSTELLQAVTNARSELEYCVLWSQWYDVLEMPGLLVEAHDAIDAIMSLCPEAKVSALLMLIVSTDSRLHS